MNRIKPVSVYYGSLAGLERKFDRLARKAAFGGGGREEWLSWREETRKKLWDLLGMDKMDVCPLKAEVQERTELADGLIREKVLLQVEPDTFMPVYILIPPKRPGEGRQGCFLALAGHQGAGKYSVAGCREIPAVADAILRFQYDYGYELARRGFVALCPDPRGFGERRDEALQGDEEASFMKSTCFHLAHMAEPLGMTVAGMLTWDLMRLIDYIKERGEWRMEDLGCVGFSGGGMQALWLAALDGRVRRAMISGYMYGYKDSLLKLNGNCSCNYVPGLWQLLDMGDIGSLIAPRPLTVQSCTEDHLNGARGMENVREQMEIIRAAYRLLGAEDRLIWQTFPGDHCFHQEGLGEALEQGAGPYQ